MMDGCRCPLVSPMDRSFMCFCRLTRRSEMTKQRRDAPTVRGRLGLATSDDDISRHFVAAQQFAGFRCEADIG